MLNARAAARCRRLLPAAPLLAALLMACTAGPRAQQAPPAPSAVECGYPAVPGDVKGVWAPEARDDEAWRGLHERYVAEAARGAAEIVFLGDSITQGWGKAPEVWSRYYAPHEALDFGISGDRLQHLAWRVEHGTLAGLSPHVLVLMIGTNNLPVRSPPQLAAAIHSLLQLLHCEQPRAKVLLLGILPRSADAEHAERALRDPQLHDNIRAVNAELARLADGHDVVFLDMGPSFAGSDGGLRPELTTDRLHLSVEGYRLWARLMEPTLSAMLAP